MTDEAAVKGEGQEPTPAEATETKAETVEAKPTLSQEDMERELKKARDDAAKYRTKLRAKEEAEQKAAEEKRKAELTAEQRAAEAETKAQEAIAQAEARALAAERKATLAGRVKDPDYALFKVNQAPEKYLKGDALNVDAFLKDYPDQALGKAGPAPTSSGGGTADKQDMNALIRDAIRQRS